MEPSGLEAHDEPEAVGPLALQNPPPLRRQVPVALVVGQPLRGPLQRTITGMGLDISVLAYPELPADTQMEPIGVIGVALAQA